MNTPDNFGGKAVLMPAPVAGMADMVALRLRVGTLMQRDFSALQAGMTVTLFPLGAVRSSLLFAPRFNRRRRRAASRSGRTAPRLRAPLHRPPRCGCRAPTWFVIGTVACRPLKTFV